MKRMASILFVLVFLTGCGSYVPIVTTETTTSGETQKTETTASVPASVEVSVSEQTGDEEPEAIPEPVVKSLAEMDETEIRAYISECEENATGLENRKSGYEELLALDVMTAEDFYLYALTVKQMGDEYNAADILWDMYRLFPTEETYNQLSEWEYVISSLPEWAGDITDADKLTAAVCGLMKDGSFAADYMWNSETTLSRKTVYEDDGIKLRMSSSGKNTKILAEYTDGTVVRFEYAGGNTVYYSEAPAEKEGRYSFVLSFGGKDKQKFVGTFKEDYCVGDLTLTVSGTKYTGTFTDKGITKEEQISGVKGVIFAYDSKKKKYLYESGVKKDEFKITKEYLGVPEFIIE